MSLATNSYNEMYVEYVESLPAGEEVLTYTEFLQAIEVTPCNPS